ncbi:hypothetical protein ACET3X_003519 [Alternaria dauci]|uniref:F-box domain-containing protein n=1 Tax=Alternaria dauci TaxID=48095 RepID=A0ABR3UT62_9PLEO
MPPYHPTEYASQTPLDIPELAGMILSHLSDIRDLLHFRETSRFFKFLVDTTSSIQRRLWKLPSPVEEGENPHSLDPTEVRDLFSIEPSKFHLIEAFSSTEWNFFDAIEGGVDVDIAVTTRNQRCLQLWMQMDPWVILTHDIIRQIPPYVCRNCYQAHVPFDSATLHHILRFLPNHNICGQGSGSDLLLHVIFGHEFGPDPIMNPALDESFAVGFHRSTLFRIASLARAVNDAQRIAEQCDLLQDYFTSPMCTRLIMMHNETPTLSVNGSDVDVIVLRTEHGLKLGKVLSQLLELCQRSFHHYRTKIGAISNYKIFMLYEETREKFPILLKS